MKAVNNLFQDTQFDSIQPASSKGEKFKDLETQMSATTASASAYASDVTSRSKQTAKCDSGSSRQQAELSQGSKGSHRDLAFNVLLGELADYHDQVFSELAKLKKRLHASLDDGTQQMADTSQSSPTRSIDICIGSTDGAGIDECKIVKTNIEGALKLDANGRAQMPVEANGSSSTESSPAPVGLPNALPPVIDNGLLLPHSCERSFNAAASLESKPSRLASKQSRLSRASGDHQPSYVLDDRWIVDPSFSNKRLKSPTKQIDNTSNPDDGDDGSIPFSCESSLGDPELSGLPQTDKFSWIGVPSSPHRLAWDFFGAILIFYDLVSLPLKVFDPPETRFTRAMEILTAIFWTLNVAALLTCGYLRNGVYIMKPKLIFINYLKTWFLIDFATLGTDWALMIVNYYTDEKTDASNVRLIRVFRLFRCVRIVRLSRLQWLYASIKDALDNAAADILLNIIKMVFCLIIVTHLVACAWFGITHLDLGPTWTERHGFSNDHWVYLYLTSFHWAITQFTPASMDVQPHNIIERCFAIVTVIFGLVGFSYLVGSITGSLTELRRMHEDASTQFWNLRRFLKKNSVSVHLRIRIEKYLEHALQLKSLALDDNGLPILKLLTEQLGNELNCAMIMPHLEVHPFFSALRHSSESTMQRVSTKGLSRRLVARGETVFRHSEIAQHMTFLVEGKLYYIRQLEDSVSKTEFVDKGEDWITEGALWVPDWMTLGSLTAVAVSELLDIDPEAFSRVLRRTPQDFLWVSKYAAFFVQKVNSKEFADLSDVGQGEDLKIEIDEMIQRAGQHCLTMTVLKRHLRHTLQLHH